jgi:formamidopyrimidine-DNA glycosylase
VPELPDVELYLHALRPRLVGAQLERIRVASPFLVHTVDPPLAVAEGRHVGELRRIGKRVVWELEGDLYLVIHLMIAGRFRWAERGTAIPARLGLAAFDFDTGTVLLTEAGAKRRATLHLVADAAGLQALDPGGIEPLAATPEDFAAALTRENHTLKRALTDPHLFSGIGNAYSDEILHAARLSPVRLTSAMAPEEIGRLHDATRRTLTEWRDRLIAEAGEAFPKKVTAFREGMAVHGRYGKPCPVCGTRVQRIRYAENETNYCPRCQTGGRILSDRSLARLLKDDWPKTIEELEGRA